MVLLGTFAPAIVALTARAWMRGRAAAEALLGQLGRWDVHARWYVFAVSYLVVIKLIVALIIRVGTGHWPRFGSESLAIMLLAVVLFALPQAGEELGWRGYALPRLTRSIGLAPGSVLLGVIWAVWHLPLFFVMPGDKMGQSFPLYLMQVTALSVAMAWLYWRTSGSLPLVMLMHSAVNNTKDIVPSASSSPSSVFTLSGSTVGWLTVALLWTGAAYLLFRMRHVRDLEVPASPG